jgi:hypothetical protein
MNRAIFSISVTSVVAMVYVILSAVSGHFPLVFFLFLVSQAWLIWMVITILKDKPSSDRTFDQFFYEDSDIRPGKDRPC